MTYLINHKIFVLKFEYFKIFNKKKKFFKNENDWQFDTNDRCTIYMYIKCEVKYTKNYRVNNNCCFTVLGKSISGIILWYTQGLKST